MFDYMAQGFMILMRGLDITRAIGRVALKIKLVLGPKIARATASSIWAQNRRVIQCNPSNGPSNVKAPHQNHKALRHIINRLIGTFMDKIRSNKIR